MKKDFIYKTECRCCGTNDLFTYIELGNQPLANSYHKNDIQLNEIPLSVNVCKKCFNSQLSVVVDPEVMFKHYLYVSGTTKTFREHCKTLARQTIDIVGIKTPNVLDIACNDGTLLAEFKTLGANVYGVDPAENIRDISKIKGFDVCVDFWNEYSSKFFGIEFDIITGTNVFAHVDDVSGFLELAKSVVSPDGRIVIEFPYCSDMIKNNEFDTVYHEHVSYFLVNSIKALTDSVGLVITNIIQSKIHGGSIRFYISKSGMETDDVSLLISKEKENGLMDINTYINFQESIDKNKIDLETVVDEYKSKDYEVICYGASAKGNTMLNYFKLDVQKTIDDNPLKVGYLTPGQNLEIVNSEYINTASDNLLIILTAWNFSDEIIQRVNEKKRDGQNIKFVLYVSSVKVL